MNITQAEASTLYSILTLRRYQLTQVSQGLSRSDGRSRTVKDLRSDYTSELAAVESLLTKLAPSFQGEEPEQVEQAELADEAEPDAQAESLVDLI